MKCKMYFKNPSQTFVFNCSREVALANYINNNFLNVEEIKSYGKVTKLIIRNDWGKIDTVKIKSFA